MSNHSTEARARAALEAASRTPGGRRAAGPLARLRWTIALTVGVAATVGMVLLPLLDAGGPGPTVLAPSSLAPHEGLLDEFLSSAGVENVTWIFAGSQTLAAQVADGAPADVVITADRESFDAARAAGADWPAEAALTTNRLVLAVAPGNPGEVDGIDALASDDLLVGLCAAEVPCGRLAAEALASIEVEPRPDTEETSVRALTAKLAAGELDVGLIYATDADAADLQVVRAPDLRAFTNTYWATASADGAAALDALASDAGLAIFIILGFGT